MPCPKCLLHPTYALLQREDFQLDLYCYTCQRKSLSSCICTYASGAVTTLVALAENQHETQRALDQPLHMTHSSLFSMLPVCMSDITTELIKTMNKSYIVAPCPHRYPPHESCLSPPCPPPASSSRWWLAQVAGLLCPER